MAAVTRAILTRVPLDIKGWEGAGRLRSIYSSNQTFALLYTDDE